MDIIPIGNYIADSPTSITSMFNITTFSVALAGGALGGLIAIITKQYVYAAGLTLLWVVGVMYEPVKWVLIGVPLLLNAILPVEIRVLGTALGVLTTVALFAFFIELLAGRQVT